MSVIGSGLLVARGEHPVEGDEIAQNPRRVLGLLWVLERDRGSRS